MTAPNSPHLDCPTDPTTGPHAAPQPVARTAMGEPKGAARKGVPTACGPDPRRADGRCPVAWLHIRAPRGATPTATSQCACGWDRSAIGHRKVHALIKAHEGHRDTCPLRTHQEERAAA
ncbi:hypothetical protein [Streptomyces sp. CA-179760]|uniref:hypothetical protein n=1 Tax=Streptomyces sp. CA-179760 TaxID=3240054 RepID=UPI003D91A153